MEAPLTPLEFARRARRVYPHREAVVDGPRRFTYAQFLDRCDRWSSVLRAFGVGPGDRVACISTNSHANLEAYYAIPQLGAIIVPINYRLSAEDFQYILNHSGAKVVCAEAEFLEAVDRIRTAVPALTHRVAFTGSRPDWISYEEALAAAQPVTALPEIDETSVLSINYTSGTTARPKGVMLTHRNLYLNILGRLVHTHLSSADRYLWTLPMFHVNGWCFVWAMTAVGGTHVCLQKPDTGRIFELLRTERITVFCAAPTILIGLANSPVEFHRSVPRV
jgi:fatty-acyl-CoA synthase